MIIDFKRAKDFDTMKQILTKAYNISNRVLFYNDIIQPDNKNVLAISRKTKIKEKKALNKNIELVEDEFEDEESDVEEIIIMDDALVKISYKRFIGAHIVRNNIDTIPNGEIYCNDKFDDTLDIIKTYTKGKQNSKYERTENELKIIMSDGKVIPLAYKINDNKNIKTDLVFETKINEHNYWVDIKDEDIIKLKNNKLLVLSEKFDEQGEVSVRIAKSLILSWYAGKKDDNNTTIKLKYHISRLEPKIYKLSLLVTHKSQAIDVIHQYVFYDYLKN